MATETSDAGPIKAAPAPSPGSDSQVQFNSSGLLGASSNLTFNSTGGRLTVPNASTTNFTALYASTTDLVASNSFTIGSLSGFLKATAGAVAATAVNLTSDIAGTLAVSNGGTGWANFAAGSIPYGNGSSAFATTSPGTAGYVLAFLNGVPTWTATTTYAAPLSYTGGTVSIINAGADDSTKGAASFSANDLDSSGGNISIDYANGQAADGSHKGFLTSADWTSFSGKVSTSRTLSAGSGLTGGGDLSSDRTVAIDFAHANSWTGLQSLANASSSLLSVTGTAYFGGTATSSFDSAGNLTLAGLGRWASGFLSNASSTITAGLFSANGGASTTNFTVTGSTWISGLTASSLLAIDQSGKLIASSTIGTSILTGTLGTINGANLTAGGSITVSAASSTLLANSNTWAGLNSFANASATLATLTTGWATKLNATYASSTAITAASFFGNLSGNASTATALQTARSINGIGFDGTADVTVTAASSTLLANSNTFTGANIFFSLLRMTSGLLSSASSTIGDGTLGLTVNGAATTTGRAYFAGNLGIGTTSAAATLALQGAGNTNSILQFATANSAGAPLWSITNGGSLFTGTTTAGLGSNVPLQISDPTGGGTWPRLCREGLSFFCSAWDNDNGSFNFRQTNSGFFALYNGATVSGGSVSGGTQDFIARSGMVAVGTTTDSTTNGAHFQIWGKRRFNSYFAITNADAGTAAGLTSGDVFKVSGGGLVGIATTSPATTLSVSGSGYLTGGLGVGLLNTTAGTINTTGMIKLLPPGGGELDLGIDQGAQLEMHGNGSGGRPYFDIASNAAPTMTSVSNSLRRAMCSHFLPPSRPRSSACTVPAMSASEEPIQMGRSIRSPLRITAFCLAISHRRPAIRADRSAPTRWPLPTGP
jgi:hypothetical protein